LSLSLSLNATLPNSELGPWLPPPLLLVEFVAGGLGRPLLWLVVDMGEAGADDGEDEREGERRREGGSRRAGMEGGDEMYGVPVPVWLREEEWEWGIRAYVDSRIPFGSAGIGGGGRRCAAVYVGTRSSGGCSAHLNALALALVPFLGQYNRWSNKRKSKTFLRWIMVLEELDTIGIWMKKECTDSKRTKWRPIKTVLKDF
jgi:hypothetical protein